MYDAEHRRGHADSDRERHNRDNRKHRLPRQRPQTEAQILNQNVQEIARDCLATFLSESLLRSKLNSGAPFGLGSRATGTLKLVSAKLNMRSKLLFQLA